MENHGNGGKPWKTMENSGKQWKTVEISGKQWKTVENHGNCNADFFVVVI